jgi:hypothetical protein
MSPVRPVAGAAFQAAKALGDLILAAVGLLAQAVALALRVQGRGLHFRSAAVSLVSLRPYRSYRSG